MSKDLNKWLDNLEEEFLSQTRDDNLIQFGEQILKSARGEYGNLPFGGAAVQRLMTAKGKTVPELNDVEKRGLNALDNYCSVYTGFALIHGTDQDRENYKGAWRFTRTGGVERVSKGDTPPIIDRDRLSR